VRSNESDRRAKHATDHRLTSASSTPSTKENAMAKSEAGESAETAGNARAKDLVGKARKTSKPKASQVVAAEATEDALAKPSETEVAETTEESSTQIEDGEAETEKARVADDIDTVQKLGTEQAESSTAAASSFLEIIQAIAAEASDYSRRSLEHGSSFVEKLFGAKSFEGAVLIQSEYARTSYAGLITYLRKMGELYTDLAKEVVKPVEAAIASFQR
jgi:hypothetical protein